MNLAAQYARALYDLMENSPAADTKKSTTYLHNLDGVLKRRGHQTLLPRIFTEYEKLQLSKKRSLEQQTLTEDQERTRTLLELYRKLTHTV